MGVMSRIASLFGATPAIRPAPGADFMRGGQTDIASNQVSPFFISWQPALRSSREDVRMAWKDAAARTIDALQNSGWIAGAVDQAVVSTIGSGLTLAAKPDALALKWDAKQASAWAKMVERRFALWAGSPRACDAQARVSLGHMTATAFRHWIATGEIVATLPQIRREPGAPALKALLLESWRVTQESNQMDRLIQGVRLDAYGAPLGYRIQQDAMIDGQTQIIDVRARARTGRPAVVHVFDGMPGQVRGISALTPALKVVRQFDQLADATLTAALLQSIFAATLESDAPTEQALRGFQDEVEQGIAPAGDGMALLEAQKAFYDGARIDLGRFGKIATLFPGDKLKFNRSEHPNSTYPDFSRILLREIARCLGLTFEQATGDYFGASYATINQATAEIWQVVLYRRQIIGARMLQPIYEAWLDEEIAAGTVPYPGGYRAFLAQRGFAVMANWRGGKRPSGDPWKDAKAVAAMKEAGLMTDEQAFAERGEDWEEQYEQLARERDERRRLGLPEMTAGARESDAAEMAAHDKAMNGA